jgi:3-oxoacyl-[acyl-carrier-protein] synthase II
MKKVFGPFLHKVYVSSQKSMIGHALGASGAVELAGALLAKEAGFLPPTINLLEPDPSCCLNHVQNRRKECKFNVFAKLSFGFGGHICCIILGDADSGGDKKEKEH